MILHYTYIYCMHVTTFFIIVDQFQSWLYISVIILVTSFTSCIFIPYYNSITPSIKHTLYIMSSSLNMNLHTLPLYSIHHCLFLFCRWPELRIIMWLLKSNYGYEIPQGNHCSMLGLIFDFGGEGQHHQVQISTLVKLKTWDCICASIL